MTTALFETEVGNINIEFFFDDAPNTVKNFTNLISDGFYDGLAFHRVILGQKILNNFNLKFMCYKKL